MTKPTQQQLNKFWEEVVAKWQLKDIMKHALDKEFRDKIINQYKNGIC